MKKYFLLVILLVASFTNVLRAQLFTAPDTVCVNQPVNITSLVDSGNSFYWGFCSGYLMDAPVGTNMGSAYSLHSPGGIAIAKDYTGNYYGFVTNESTTELIRLSYGNSLNNVPTVTDFGNMTGDLPVNPTSEYLIQDTFSGNWYLFVTGGYTPATSTLARLDFGPSLGNNVPNIANFGNRNNAFNGPKGIFVAQDASNNWFGYLVNRNTDELIRLDFSFNISNTPIASSLGNPKDEATLLPMLSTPTDLAAIYDQNNWYLFVTNETGNDVARIDLGTGLDTNKVMGSNLGTFLYRINAPSALSINRDCGYIYVYVTDSTTGQLIAIQMPYAVGPYYSIDYGIVGGMNLPSAISTIIRDSNSLYGYITNVYDSSITKVEFESCHNSTIPSFGDWDPPTYSYDSPGVYNIYEVVNQGLPYMQVQCKQITVLPKPFIVFPPDTMICEGSMIKLYATSNTSDSTYWWPAYNIDTNYAYVDSVRVWPAQTTSYSVAVYYPDGCIVDTSVLVTVSEVYADAGPDRTINDGSYTVLGGPNTSMGNYSYYWTPYQYMSDTTVPFPVASPPYTYTYFFTVTEYNDALGCQHLIQ